MQYAIRQTVFELAFNPHRDHGRIAFVILGFKFNSLNSILPRLQCPTKLIS